MRAVEQLDARSGKVLNRFRSQATAARAADILWSCTIGTVCRAGKGTAGGFGWRFARSVWACCSDCGVWRRLALGTPAPAEDERWTCAQAGRGCNCAAPPDELSSDESLESGDGSSSSSSEDEGPEDATQALPPADATRGRAGQRVGHDGAEVRDHEIGIIAAERSASCHRPPPTRTAGRGATRRGGAGDRSARDAAEFYVCRDNETPSMVAKACDVDTGALLREVRAGSGEGSIAERILSASTNSTPLFGWRVRVSVCVENRTIWGKTLAAGSRLMALTALRLPPNGAGSCAHPSPGVPRVFAGTGVANAGAQKGARPVEVRCSLERVRERAAHERHIANQPNRSHHTERGDPSLSAFGVPGATH